MAKISRSDVYEALYRLVDLAWAQTDGAPDRRDQVDEDEDTIRSYLEQVLDLQRKAFEAGRCSHSITGFYFETFDDYIKSTEGE